MKQPIKKQIDNFLDSIKKRDEKVKEIIDGLEKFYADVKSDEEWLYGEKDPETGERVKAGWKEKAETDIRQKMVEVSRLLAGATTAGLANSFDEYRQDARESAQWCARFFYFILVVLSGIGAWFYWSSVGDGYEEFFQNLPYRLLVIAPIVWLALVVSKRRSEFFRLEQEYAHKTAIAKSYLSFEEQIEQLGITDNALKSDLMQLTLEAISANVATTLEKKHGDNLPMIEVLKTASKKATPKKGGE